MSSSTLGPQSASILGPYTPSNDLSTHHLHSSKPVFTGSWTAPFRDGLPTPPSDMTGLTYNAIPSSAHGGKVAGMPPHYYNSMRPFDSMSSSMMNAMKPANPAPAKDVAATEPVQKKSTGTTSGSQLRIPSSINNSKGSLAEFAAQVRGTAGAPAYCWKLDLTFEFHTDDMPILVRKDVQTASYRRPPTLSTVSCSRSDSYPGLSEMGGQHSLDHSSQSKCYLARLTICLSIEKVQCGSQGKEGK